MNNELITIVVPIYNVEKYLDRCLNSIVNQTYKNLEIILVDDGSPDRCPEMCDEWAKKDSRIKVIHKENAGAGLARNTGLECATGEYICFFDSDDYVDITLIEKAYSAIKKSKSNITIYGMTHVLLKNGIKISYKPKTEKDFYYGQYITEKFLPDLIDPNNQQTQNKNLPFSLWSCLFDISLFKESPTYFESERDIFSEDSLMLLELYNNVHKISILKESLYFYCENENSVSHTIGLRNIDKIEVFHNKCLEIIEKNNYPQQVKERICSLVMSFVIGTLKNINRSNIKVKEKIVQIKNVVTNDFVQHTLHNENIYNTGWKRRCLFIFMRYRAYFLTYLLINLNRKGRK